jgi:predicted nucleic acid-binding protein
MPPVFLDTSGIIALLHTPDDFHDQARAGAAELRR